MLGVEVLPLYRDPCFTFRFADDRSIGRIHLEGVQSGRRVILYKIDAETGDRLGLLTMGSVGTMGWTDLDQPIVVRAGDAFVAILS